MSDLPQLANASRLVVERDFHLGAGEPKAAAPTAADDRSAEAKVAARITDLSDDTLKARTANAEEEGNSYGSQLAYFKTMLESRLREQGLNKIVTQDFM